MTAFCINYVCVIVMETNPSYQVQTIYGCLESISSLRNMFFLFVFMDKMVGVSLYHCVVSCLLPLTFELH